MVTADGTIKTVEASEEPELAVALRGSGSQFGEQLDPKSSGLVMKY